MRTRAGFYFSVQAVLAGIGVLMWHQTNHPVFMFMAGSATAFAFAIVTDCLVRGRS